MGMGQTVTSVSSTAANGTYKVGDVIPITVTFSANVTVTGTPQLTLETGSTDVVVDYTSGSGTSTLTFNYMVAAGHNSSDLDFVGTGSLGLREPSFESISSKNLNSRGAADIAIKGNYAFLVDSYFHSGGGLYIVDISDPSNPGTPIHKDTNGEALAISVNGNYAYIASYDDGLAIIDISDPTNPGTPVYRDTNGQAYDVAVNGNYAYVSDYQSGLAIIDISDLSNIGTPVYRDTEYALSVKIKGDYAYVADNEYGLAIIDISDPSNPGTPVYRDTDGNAQGLTIDGDYAYVSDGGPGLAIIDISDPTNPGTPVYRDTDGNTAAITINGNYAFLGSSHQLAVIDISDPTNPGNPVYVNTERGVSGVKISGDYAFLSVGGGSGTGLVIIKAVTTDLVNSNGSRFSLQLPSPGASNSLGANKAIVIDGTAPTVSNITASTADGSYKVGDVIAVNVVFSEVVNVTGTPQLTLETGSSDAAVNYSSGSGTNTLTFNYTIASGHSTGDLDYVATSSLALNSGTIKDVAGNVATLTLASPGASGSLGANKALAIVPTVTLSSNVTTIAEDGTAVITATLDYASTIETVVSFAATGSAVLDGDYSVDYTGKGTVVTVAGGNGEGSGTNQLANPYGIALDQNGNIYVGDASNYRVQKWVPGSAEGTTVAGGNGSGSAANQLSDFKGIAVDGSGNIFIAGSNNDRIQKWVPGATTGITVAGGNGEGSAANQLNHPTGLALDIDGNIYVADGGNYRVQKFPSNSTSSTNGITVAGGDVGIWNVPNPDQIRPFNVGVDKTGNIYVADVLNHRIQKFPSNSTSSTDGITVAGGNGSGSGTNRLANPYDIALDQNGNIYVSDATNRRVQKFPSNSTVSTDGITVAGGNGPGSNSNQFYDLREIDLDAAGNLYAVDRIQNHRVQKIYLGSNIIIPAGQTSTTLTITGTDDAIDESDETIILTPSASGAVLASSAALNIAFTDNDLPPAVTSVTSTTADGAYKEGQAIAITVTFDKAVTVTGTPKLTLETGSSDAVVDYSSGTGTTTLTFNYTIGSGQNSDDLDYVATTSLALNSGTIKETGGTSAATLTLPSPGATNSLGANKALVIDTTVPTMAITATNGTSAVDDGSSSNAILTVTFTASEATTDFAETDITVTGGTISNFTAVSSTVYTATFTPTGAGAKTINVAANTFTDVANNSNPAANQFNWTYIVPVATLTTDKTDFAEHQSSVITATLSAPSVQETVIAFTPTGTAVMDSDYELNYSGKGAVSTIAGGNGEGVAANQLYGPRSVAVDVLGNVYVVDEKNNRIQKWASGATEGTTVVGELYDPMDAAVDASGNVYLALHQYHGIRKWAPGATTGTTVAAGNGIGSASNQLRFPTGVAVDALGNVYVADSENHRIQKWAPGASEGTTVAGGNGRGSAANQLSSPSGVAVDASGNVFIADGNFRIQKWAPGASEGTTVAGGNGNGSAANQLSYPYDVALDTLGNIYIADYYNNRVQKVLLVPTIIIPAGQTTSTLTITGVKDKLLSEGTETIILTPSATNATLASSDAINLNLLDNGITLTKKDDPFIGLSNGSVSWGDYDRDGDKDVAIMGQSSLYGAVTAIYRNDGGTFKNTNQNFARLYSGDITWIDIDQDGYLDLVVSGFNQTGQTILYKNNSGLYFTQDETLNLPQLFTTQMDWGDLDLDGDVDFIMMGIDNSGALVNYLGFKSGDKYELVKDKYPGLIKGEVKIVDIDLDGDNDIIYSGEDINGNAGSRTITNTLLDNTNSIPSIPNLKSSTIELVNTGASTGMGILVQGKNSSGSFNSYNMGSYNLGAITEKLHSGDISAADFNNDGKIDIVLTGEDDNGTAITKLYWDWAGSHEAFDITLEGLRESTAEWVDYDMDGDLDLFLMGISSTGAKTILYETEVANKKNTAPAAPTNLTSTDLGFGSVKLSWDVPSDEFNSSLGYKLRLGTTLGGSELSYVSSNPTTGVSLLSKAPPINTNQYELQLEPGTYYWSVQAVDNGLKSGKFATEGSFTLTYDWKAVNQGGIIDYAVSTKSDPVLKMVDIDGDDDLDVLYGSISTGTTLLQFDGKRLETNTDSKYSFISNSRNIFDIQAGDINGDGIQDVWISYTNGNGATMNVSNSSSFTSVSGLSDYYLYNSKSKIADINNDGRKEIISLGLTNNTVAAELKLFVLDYDLSSSTLKIIDQSSQITNLTASSFDFADYDLDQDIDFVISGFNANDGLSSVLYKNETPAAGDLILTKTSNNFAAVRDGTTDFIDFDSDGDLDVVFTGTSFSGDIFEIYINMLNEGVTQWPRIETNITGIRNSSIDLGDFNGDGYTDIIYSGTRTGEGEVTKLSEYNPATKQYVASSFDIGNIIKASVEFGDIDGDGDLDLCIAGEDKSSGANVFKTYRNYRNESAAVSSGSSSGRSLVSSAPAATFYVKNEAPTAPKGLSASITEISGSDELSLAEFSWSAASDDHTPVAGLTYALRIGTASGKEDVLSSDASSTGTRKSASKGNAGHNLKWKLALPDGSYYWSVQAVDAAKIGSKFSSESTFQISNGVVEQNNPPSISDTTFTIAENSDNGVLVGTVKASDGEGDTITFKIISGNTAQAFSLDSLRGELKVLRSELLNYEITPQFILEVQASDGLLSVTAKITINLTDEVEDENKAPVLSDKSIEVAENTANGTLLTTLEATDVNNDSLSYRIISGNSYKTFSLDSASGRLIVFDSTLLDYETNPTFSLVIEVSDGLLTDSADITIKLKDVFEEINERPTIEADTFSVVEHNPNGTIVGTVRANDANGDELSYQITSYDLNNTFSIDGKSGEITVSNSLLLDYEKTPSFALIVEVSDGLLDSSAKIIVNLLDVDESVAQPPIINDQVFTLLENSLNNAFIGTVEASDANGDTLTYAIISGNSDQVFALDSDKGDLTLADSSKLDIDSIPSYSLLIKVSDGALSDSATVIIDLIDVEDDIINQQPTILSSTYSIAENSPNGTVLGTVEATDPDGDTLTYVIVNGNDAEAFSLDSESGELTVSTSSALDFETTPTYSLGIEVSDGALSDVAIFTINLTDVEEEEEILSLADASEMIYPNPTDGIINIKMNQFKEATIYNLSGKRIMRSTDNRIDVSSLSEGVYIIKLENRSGDRFSTRLIKE